MGQEQRAIDSLITEERTFPPPPAINANAYTTRPEQTSPGGPFSKS